MADTIGPYEIRGELGRGAMAVVWHGWDPRLERDVAIKEPVVAHGTDENTRAELAARFVREGMAAAKLNHPGIVTVFSADVYDGRPGIVMELIEGETLGDLLDRGRMAPGLALSILDQLLDAAGYAHERGVVHRDIKPDNIFITREGRVKLTDFGIAHIGTSATLTQAGTVMGTPGYMAPEQVTGGAVDARADLFSIGVLGYEMLAGRNPFGTSEGTAPTTVMYRIVHEAMPALPMDAMSGLPCDLATVLTVALAKDPNARFQNAGSFRAALRGAPVQVSAAGAPYPAPGAYPGSGAYAAQAVPASGKMPGWLPYAGVVGVAAVIGVVLLLSATGPGAGGGVAGTGGVAVAGSGVQAGAQVSAPLDVQLVVDPAGEIPLGASGTIEVVVSDPSVIATVEVTVNGEAIGSVAGDPLVYVYFADTPGTFSVSATVTDVNGGTWTAPAANFMVADDPEEAITAVVQEWCDSFARLDLDSHVDCYASVVAPYFGKSSLSNAEVRANKQGAFSKSYSVKEMYVRNVVVTMTGTDTASVLLDKEWDFISDTRFAGAEQQRLTFVREGGEWKIASEVETEIYWVERS